MRLGGDRHEAIIWALRLLVWTGARLEEIFQLNKDDVKEEWRRPTRVDTSRATGAVDED